MRSHLEYVFSPGLPCLLLQGSFGAFAVIDCEKKLPRYCNIVPEHHVRSWRKRKRSLSEAGSEEKSVLTGQPDDAEATICLRYNSVLHMDFVADNEMVIVEQPWLSVIETFPAALERKMFGT